MPRLPLRTMSRDSKTWECGGVQFQRTRGFTRSLGIAVTRSKDGNFRVILAASCRVIGERGCPRVSSIISNVEIVNIVTNDRAAIFVVFEAQQSASLQGRSVHLAFEWKRFLGEYHNDSTKVFAQIAVDVTLIIEGAPPEVRKREPSQFEVRFDLSPCVSCNIVTSCVRGRS